MVSSHLSTLQVRRIGRPSCPTILCAAGAEAVATEHRSAWLWFEGHGVGLAALIANDFESFAFRPSSLARATKVGAARVAAGFATLRMAQATLPIVFLFSFSKGEGVSAFGAGDFQIWHRYLPRKIILRFASVSLWAKFTPRLGSCTANVRQPLVCGSQAEKQTQERSTLELLDMRSHRLAQRLQIVTTFHAGDDAS